MLTSWSTRVSRCSVVFRLRLARDRFRKVSTIVELILCVDRDDGGGRRGAGGRRAAGLGRFFGRFRARGGASATAAPSRSADFRFRIDEPLWMGAYSVRWMNLRPAPARGWTARECPSTSCRRRPHTRACAALRQQAGKSFGNDVNREMAAPSRAPACPACRWLSSMISSSVGCSAACRRCASLSARVFAERCHGSTFTKGRTSHDSNTPSVTYGRLQARRARPRATEIPQ